MNSQSLMQNRYTCKAYDPYKHISDEVLNRLLEVLRLSPSSINMQAWQFLVAKTAQAKQNIVQATQGENEHNRNKILHSSCVIVLTSKKQVDATHFKQVIAQEAQAGRFATAEAQQKRTDLVLHYLQEKQNLAQHEFEAWVNKQVYIALGALLLAAEMEGIQATTIEGFDKATLDQVLDLSAQNLSSQVIVALGYASDDDFNRQLPKARFSAEQVIQYLD